MAGIGLYGVYYAKATLVNGAITGYGTVKQMGRAISASYEPAESGQNILYANNSIAETDTALVAGGELTLVLDRLIPEARADLFGLTQTTKSVTVDSETVTGSGFEYDGNESAAPVGVAFIRQSQELQDRNIHDVVIFSYVTFNEPTEEFETLGESVEWQTPEFTGTVSGASVTHPYPWKTLMRFASQEAAIQYINDYFAN